MSRHLFFVLFVFALIAAGCATGVVAPTSTPVPPTVVPATAIPATSAPNPAITPGLTVADQEIKEASVTIPSVIAAEPGWLVVHIAAEGKPGPVVGQTLVKVGENANVVVAIDTSRATETLFAMLHVDQGQVGVYEFPGSDAPVKVGDAIVMKPFKATQPATAAPTQSQVQVLIKSFKFGANSTLTIAPGTTVVWRNEDKAPHTVTADDGSYDSGNMGQGAEFSHTFTQAGEYPYYCAYHGGPGGTGMSGKVIVKAQ